MRIKQETDLERRESNDDHCREKLRASEIFKGERNLVRMRNWEEMEEWEKVKTKEAKHGSLRSPSSSGNSSKVSLVLNS